MNNFLFSLNVVAPLFVLMASGYLVRRIGFITDDFLAQLNRFVFRLLLPVMLFQDIRLSYEGDFSNTGLIFASLIGVSTVILLSFLIVPLFIKRKGQRGSMIQAIYRSNFLIYGLPLATGMYGDAALSRISMLMGIMIPFYNVAAVIILSIHSETGKHKISFGRLLRDIVTNPLIIGSFFGILGGATHLRFPAMLEIPLAQFGSLGAPLALFVMGGEFRFNALGHNLPKVIAASFCRLILVPVIAVFVFIQIGFRNVDLAVLLTIFATPTAMASYIMAKNMGNDGELSAQIVVVSTAFSCVSIFFLIYLLRTWGYL